MVIRIALRGRMPTLIAIDAGGIMVEHATRILPRGHIPFERLAAVRIGTLGRDVEPHWPFQLRLVLRDGMPTIVPIRESDVATVRDTLQSAIATFCPNRADPTMLAPPERGVALAVETLPQPLWFRDTRAAELQRFPDGIRWIITPGFGWLPLHTIRGGFVIGLAAMLGNFVLPGGLQPWTFLQWLFVYMLTLFVLYGWPTPARETRRPGKTTIDVIGDTLILSDPDYHGQTRQWPRAQIRSIHVGGPLCWITRAGVIRAELIDGGHVTLLHAYPLGFLKPIARELNISLQLSHCDSPHH